METHVLRRSDKDFPLKLRAKFIKPPIEKLWYRGEWDKNIFRRCVAVVGSRRMSRYGRQVVEEIVPRLCNAGYTIVSGLMYGVDQLAHKVTLEHGGRAIAVLGYGITNNNEEGAWALAQQIVEQKGIVMSEYEGESVSQMWMFPQRNRIVVSLSEIVIVVEAGIKSGSLGTAKLATRYGKRVFAVPGPIFSPTSEGTNSVIGTNLAEMLTLDAVTKITGIRYPKQTYEKLIRSKLNAGEREIFTLIKMDGPQNTNEIARRLRTPTREILSLLSQMEMREIVKEERGVWKCCLTYNNLT